MARSTIHQAQGLEAERVSVIEVNMLALRWKREHPDQFQQELFLLLVPSIAERNEV